MQPPAPTFVGCSSLLHPRQARGEYCFQLLSFLFHLLPLYLPYQRLVQAEEGLWRKQDEKFSWSKLWQLHMADASCRASIFDHLFCIREPGLSCEPPVAGKVSHLSWASLCWDFVFLRPPCAAGPPAPVPVGRSPETGVVFCLT